MNERGPGWLGGRGQIDAIWCTMRFDPSEVSRRLPSGLRLSKDAEGTVLIYLGRNQRTQAGLLGVWSPLGVFDYTELFVALPDVVHPGTGGSAVYLHRIVLDHRLAEMSGALYRFPVTRTAIERSSEGLTFRVPSSELALSARFEPKDEWAELGKDETRQAWWRSLSTDWITSKGGSLHLAPFHWSSQGAEMRPLAGDITWADEALGFPARAPSDVVQVRARWQVAAPKRCVVDPQYVRAPA